jgi:hypothetical protein
MLSWPSVPSIQGLVRKDVKASGRIPDTVCYVTVVILISSLSELEQEVLVLDNFEK